MTYTYTVYVKTDEQNNIIAVNSSAFLTDTEGWVPIDEGLGDKYHHAQNNYFDAAIITDKGIYRYTLTNGIVTEKTPEAIEAEVALLPPTTPDKIAQLRADVDYMAVILEVEL